ncbi:hypothetical protein TNCV_5078881 [Trichonephila clavipes]|nr:hypothetical protein TNCV_5078881 [Trichonephila clavipes]
MSANPYEVQVEKLECIGLIQKSMGTRLLDLKSETEKKNLIDGKCLSGRNRLADILISKIQRRGSSFRTFAGHECTFGLLDVIERNSNNYNKKKKERKSIILFHWNTSGQTSD